MPANTAADPETPDVSSDVPPASESPSKVKDDDGKPEAEIGGRGGLDPTRYGDWEKNGRCIDF
ncbi:MAG: DUF1674 domain-containing protein [Gammaproteobacteria bacterium]